MADSAPTSVVKGADRSDQRKRLRRSATEFSLVTVEMEPSGFGLMLDISEGGAGVQVMNRIEPGTNVQIAFKLPELETRIEGSGVISWCDGDGRVGVRFHRLKDEGGKELRQWIDSLPESVLQAFVVAPKLGQPELRDQISTIQSRIVASDLNVGSVLQFLVERAVETTHSSGGAIALGEKDNMVCCASNGLAPDIGVTIGSGSALTDECLRTGKIVRCEDTETDVRVDEEICRELSLRSSVILPILYQGQVKGVLEVFSPLPKAFSDQHVVFLQKIAEFAAQTAFAGKSPVPAQTAVTANVRPKPEHTVPIAVPTATVLSKADVPVPTAEAGPGAATAARRAPIKQQAIATSPTTTLPNVVKVESSVVSEVSHLIDEEVSEASSHRSVFIIVAAFLLVLIAYGWWYKSGSNKTVQPPSVSVAPATQQPPVATPAPASSIAPVLQVPQPKPTRAQPVAADTIRRRNAAVIIADPSTPLVIATGSKPMPKPDTSATEVPSVNITSGANLAGINLPGTTTRPELQPQGIVSGGKLLRRVEPSYPLFAKQQHIQGDIVLSARVTKDGSVEHIKKRSGSPILEPAAVAAVRQWKYDPYKLNGQPQEVDVSITIQFRLKQ